MIVPDSGRLAVRNFSSGASAVVGILHLPPEFIPEEGASYLMYLSDRGVALEPDQVGKPLPAEYAGNSINNTLVGNFWHKTSVPGTLTVRFTSAFPDENGWTVYGAANQVLFPAERYSSTGHVWCNVRAGNVSQIEAPACDTGITAGQLVRDNVVWPNRAGVLYSLPDIDSAWRQPFLDYALVQARYGAGEISRDEMTSLVRADPKLFQVRSGMPDEQYCKYLALLREAGGIELMRPLTAEESQEKSFRAASLVRQLIEQDEGVGSLRTPTRKAS